jgi:hypothetical protein
MVDPLPLPEDEELVEVLEVPDDVDLLLLLHAAARTTKVAATAATRNG